MNVGVRPRRQMRPRPPSTNSLSRSASHLGPHYSARSAPSPWAEHHMGTRLGPSGWPRTPAPTRFVGTTSETEGRRRGRGVSSVAPKNPLTRPVLHHDDEAHYDVAETPTSNEMRGALEETVDYPAVSTRVPPCPMPRWILAVAPAATVGRREPRSSDCLVADLAAATHAPATGGSTQHSKIKRAGDRAGLNAKRLQARRGRCRGQRNFVVPRDSR